MTAGQPLVEVYTVLMLSYDYCWQLKKHNPNECM